MKRPWVDRAWRLAVGLFAEVLHPLLVIWLALFVSVGYIMTLLMPMQIGHWVALLAVTLAASLAGLLLRFRASIESGSGGCLNVFRWRALLPLIPLLVFLPLFYAELADPTLQIIGHIDIHAGYVNQLLYGATPLESVQVAGEPVNYHWLFHTPLAAMTAISDLPASFLASLLNIAVIAVSFYLLAEVILMLDLAEAGGLRLGFLVALAYCGINMFGVPAALGSLLDGSVDWAGPPRDMLLPGADRRLHSVMAKVMNFNSMAIGLMCFIASLRECLRFLRGKLDRLGLVTLSACAAVCLAMRPLAALTIALALGGGMAVSGVIMALDRGAPGRHPATLLRLALHRAGFGFTLLWLAGSLLAIMPLTHYVLALTRHHEAGVWVEPTSYQNVVMLLAALQIFLPLFGLQCLYALRARRQALWFMQCAALIALGMAAVLRMPDDGQYKLVYFASILVALSGLLALQNLARAWGRGRFQPIHWLTVCMIALTFARIVFVKAHFDKRAERLDFVYDGRHIVYRGGYAPTERMAAYAWIRQNTPTDAIALLPGWPEYFEHALYERQTYVRASLNWYTENSPNFPARVEHALQFFGDAPMRQPYAELAAAILAQLPGRKIYAVILDSELPAEVIVGAGGRRVYKDPGGGAHVYLLNP